MTNPNPSASHLPRAPQVDRPAPEATPGRRSGRADFLPRGGPRGPGAQPVAARAAALLPAQAGGRKPRRADDHRLRRCLCRADRAVLVSESRSPLDARMPPTLEGQHYFGTDVLGRDYFSRTVFGIRTSLYVAGVVALLSTLIGALYGAVSGYFGGWIDNMMMRFVDLVLTLPILAVLIVIAALWGNGTPVRVAVILALFYWTTLARIIRGNFLSLTREGVRRGGQGVGCQRHAHHLSAHVAELDGSDRGQRNPDRRHGHSRGSDAVLPRLRRSATRARAGQADRRQCGFMQSMPWLVMAPGITIVVIVLCINFVGDGLRDALDPTQRRLRA